MSYFPSSAFSPALHHTQHEDSGADEVSVASLSGLLATAQTPLAHKTSHQDSGTDEISVAGLSGLLADGQTPLAHKTSHESGGSDAIKLDDLAAPDDNTDLNASTSTHGLLQKLPGGTTTFLRADGTFATPPGTGSGITELTGEVTAGPASGSQAATIANDAVTYAKMQNVSATDKVLGRSTAGSGDVEEIACTAAGRALIDDADATAQRATLGLGTLATLSSAAEANISLSDNTTDDVSSTKHGFAPKSPADATKFLNGAATPAYALVKDSDLSTSDITTNDVTTSKHGFAPKAPNDTTKFLRGDGSWAVPGSGGGLVQYSQAKRTSGNVTTTSTSFTDLTSMSVTLTTGARRCLINFICSCFQNGPNTMYFDIDIDGTRQGGTTGLVSSSSSANGFDENVSFTFMTDVLSAASHTIKIQWKVSSGTGTVYANSTTQPVILGVTETGLTT
jgi:hypothetical protein